MEASYRGPFLGSLVFSRGSNTVVYLTWCNVYYIAFLLFFVCLFFHRAVYFACYSKAKERFNGIFVPNSNIVHICSAGSAGTCLFAVHFPYGLQQYSSIQTLNSTCRAYVGICMALRCTLIFFKYVFQAVINTRLVLSLSVSRKWMEVIIR